MAILSVTTTAGVVELPPYTDIYFIDSVSNLIIYDIIVSEDAILVLPEIQDGGKVGLRFWATDPNAGKVITFPTNSLSGIVGSSGSFQTTGLDYAEMIYCSSNSMWAVISLLSQIIPL